MSRLSELISLVQALTPAERRHFTRMSQASSGHTPSQHAQLFQVLESLSPKSGDPESLIRKAGLSRNLPTLLARLDDQILSSQVQLHAKKQVDSALYHTLAEIEILYNKQQVPKSIRTIQWARKRARKYSRANLELEVLQWERKVLARENPKHLPSVLTALREEEIHLIQVLQLQRQLSHLQSEARTRAREGLSPEVPAERARIEACNQPQLFAEALATGDFLCAVYVRNICGIYHIMCKQHVQALQQYLPLIDFWESNASWFDDQPELLLIIFSNFHLTCMHAGMEIPRLEHFFGLLHGYEFKDSSVRLLFQRITYQAEFLTYMNTGQMEKTADLATRLELWLTKRNKDLSPSQRLTFLHNLVIFHFLNGSASSANRILLRLLGMVGSRARLDIQDFARVLQVILHFDFGNEGFCENLIRNQLRYFARVRKGASPHIANLKLIRRIIGAASPRERHQVYAEWLTALEAETAFLGREELMIWCRARMAGHSLKVEFLRRVEKGN